MLEIEKLMQMVRLLFKAKREALWSQGIRAGFSRKIRRWFNLAEGLSEHSIDLIAQDLKGADLVSHSKASKILKPFPKGRK